MKKIFKLTTIASLAATLVLVTGCSCRAKQSKIDENSLSAMESDMLVYNDVATDFVATYNEKVGNKEYTYIVRRDMETKKYQFETKIVTGSGDEATTEFYKYEAYNQGSSVYIVSIDEEGVKGTPRMTDYAELVYAYTNSSDLHEKGLLNVDYYKYTGKIYEEYKSVPYNACASEGDKTKLPNILPATVEESSSCKGKKELFGDEYTYEITYRISISELVKMVVTIEGGRLVSVERTHTIASGQSTPTTKKVNFNVDFSDVKL